MRQLAGLPPEGANHDLSSDTNRQVAYIVVSCVTKPVDIPLYVRLVTTTPRVCMSLPRGTSVGGVRALAGLSNLGFFFDTRDFLWIDRRIYFRTESIVWVNLSRSVNYGFPLYRNRSRVGYYWQSPEVIPPRYSNVNSFQTTSSVWLRFPTYLVWL